MRSRAFLVAVLICLLFTPNPALASKGQLKYDVSYTSIFPPTTSKQVIARYLFCDNPFFGGVLKRVTRDNGEQYAFSYDAEDRVVNITTKSTSISYTYDTVHPQNIIKKRYTSLTSGQITGIHNYEYNKTGRLVRELRGGQVYATYKETPQGVIHVRTFGGLSLYLLGNQQPANTWSRNYYHYEDAVLDKPIAYWTYNYDSKGHVTQEDYYVKKTSEPLTYGRQGKTTYKYNAVGKLIVKRLYRGDGTHIGKSTYEYDQSNRLVRSAEYLGPVSSYEYVTSP